MDSSGWNIVFLFLQLYALYDTHFWKCPKKIYSEQNTRRYLKCNLWILHIENSHWNLSGYEYLKYIRAIVYLCFSHAIDLFILIFHLKGKESVWQAYEILYQHAKLYLVSEPLCTGSCSAFQSEAILSSGVILRTG